MALTIDKEAGKLSPSFRRIASIVANENQNRTDLVCTGQGLL